VPTGSCSGSAALKASTTEAVIDTTAPMRRGFAELTREDAYLADVLGRGADRAAALAASTLGW
jgi:hypothetical protein